MVIIMKPGTTQERIDALAHELEVKGLRVGITNGVGCSILGLVGDTTNLDADDLMPVSYTHLDVYKRQAFGDNKHIGQNRGNHSQNSSDDAEYTELFEHI